MLSLLVASLLLSSSPAFCSGYRQGFTAAYCQGHQFCTSAPVPACPSADSEAGFQDGYDRGYADGERAHPGH